MYLQEWNTNITKFPVQKTRQRITIKTKESTKWEIRIKTRINKVDNRKTEDLSNKSK